MAYIGRGPVTGSFEKQTFTADGSTTTFTLNYTVGSSSAILVVIVRLFAAASIPVPIANVLAASPDNALELNFTSAAIPKIASKIKVASAV